MNTQPMQNCTQATVICLINTYVDSIIEKYRMHRFAAQVERDRRQMYRELKKLNAENLRDIGMDDPQRQLETLGRYL